MYEETLFHLALEQPAAERAAFLDKMCGDDRALRQRVEALLQAHDNPGDFLAKPVIPQEQTVDEPRLAEKAGSRIGPYKLLQQIGEGGMGVVFMAGQTEPVRRRVALKVIKPGMDTHQVVARFEAERQALALMDHPNIAKVLDAGATESGRPYFVMELVKGVPITKYCDEHRLTPQQRLELFIPVCQAVQHAHHKGIIHRDLKPSNVLIASYDGKPVPKVIDFGVAKAVGGGLTDKTLFTDFGSVVGTLEYMSPEQAEPNQLDIDTRSDLYALGVLLYELLTGTTPFERKRLRAVALLECLRIIREEEPQKPSTRLSTAERSPSIAANRGLEPKKLTGVVRGDLDWIVMKCLEKDRNRRYETANGLAMDVHRYLADEPVLASPPSPVYRLRKFTRRHKGGLLTTTAAFVILVLAGSGVGWALWDRAAQDEARRVELAGRMAATEKAVTVALAKAEQSEERAKRLPCTTSVEAKATLVEWRDAAASLAEAEAALTTGAATDALQERVGAMRQRVESGQTQGQRIEKLFRDLDDARMAIATWKGSHFDYAGAAAKYEAAFVAFGLEILPGRTAVLAEQIRAQDPAVHDALIVALDFCAFLDRTTQMKSDIARAADQDPWRQEYREAVAKEDGTALVRLSQKARSLTVAPASLQLLADALYHNGRREEALDLLRWARELYPTDFWIAYVLGDYLYVSKASEPVVLEERVGCYRVAVALRPDASAAHISLGHALHRNKQLDEAIAEYQEAIALDPKDANSHSNLGIALDEKNKQDDAIAELKEAIALDPKHVDAHLGLGTALYRKKQIDAAIAEFNQTIALDAKYVMAHIVLGIALRDKNQLDAAIAEFNKAIEIDPNDAGAYYNLGLALHAKNQLDGAIAVFKKAIALEPKDVKAHFNLGNALRGKNQWDDAIAAYDQAIVLNPRLAQAHLNRGLALCAKNQLDDGIAALNTAIDIDAKIPNAHGALGQALLGKGRFAEAKASTQKALDLLPEQDPLRALVLRQRDHCDVLLQLAAKLPDILAGKAQPKDNGERFGFIEVCQCQQRYAAGAKLYADAFAADAKLADDLNAFHRHNAACHASMAGAGQGTDADKLDAKERARLRKQALEWLRADLELWTKRLADAKPQDLQALLRALKLWQENKYLIGIRDAKALEKLPAGERETCQKLWADVAELVKKAAQTK